MTYVYYPEGTHLSVPSPSPTSNLICLPEEVSMDLQTHSKKKVVQFSSVSQSRPTLCNPMDCSMSGLPVHHQLSELTQTDVHRVGDAIHISSSVVPFSSCLHSFPELGSFLMSQFFTSGGQSFEASASASVLPLNIQD